MAGYYREVSNSEWRKERIEFYTRCKRDREATKELLQLEQVKNDEEFVRLLTFELENYDSPDEPQELRPDWNLVDRISYDEIGDYIDRGLLP